MNKIIFFKELLQAKGLLHLAMGQNPIPPIDLQKAFNMC